MATEPEDIGQDVVILTETDQELQLNQHAEQEALQAHWLLESFTLSPSSSTEENLVDTHPTVSDTTTESPRNTTPTLDLLQALNETLSPTELSSQHPTALMNSTISTTETFDSPQNTSLQPSVYNETDSHHNFTSHQSELESTTGFPESSYEPHTHNQTAADTKHEDNTFERPEESQEIQETNLHFDKSQANYSESDSNQTQEESFWEVTSMTLDPVVQLKLEETTEEDHVQVFLSTQASKKEGELLTQPAQTTKSTIREQTSIWADLDGSGDISQGMSSINFNFLVLKN